LSCRRRLAVVGKASRAHLLLLPPPPPPLSNHTTADAASTETVSKNLEVMRKFSEQYAQR